MAELNTAVPAWLQKRQESFIDNRPKNTAEIVMRGFELGLRQQDQALRERNALMEFQKDQFQKERYMLETKEKMMEMDDLRLIANARQEYMHGNTSINPPLNTYNGQRIWHTWKSNQSVEIRRAQELVTFNEQVSKLDGFGIAAVRAVGDWTENGIQPTHYEKLGHEQKRVRSEALKARYGVEEITVGDQRYIKTPTGGLHLVPQTHQGPVPATPIVDDQGNVLGYGFQGSRGFERLPPVRVTRHQLQSTLDRAEADFAAAKVDPARRTELPALFEKVKSLKKSIEAEQQPQPLAPSRVPMLRYNSTTDTLR